MNTSNMPITPLPQASQASISVRNGLLQIGGKRFCLKKDGKEIKDAGTLNQVGRILEAYHGNEIQNSINKQVESGHQKLPIKIVLTEDGAKIDQRPVSVPVKFIGAKGEVKQQFSSEIQEIAEQQKYVSDLEAVLSKYSRAEISTTINTILRESHSSLIACLDETNFSEWGEKTVSDLLQETGNEALALALTTVLKSNSSENTIVNKPSTDCFHDVIVFLLSNFQRNPKSMPASRGGEYVQYTFKGKGSLERNSRFGDIVEVNKGLPSEADKGKYQKKIEDKNTNLGSVIKCDSSGEAERVVVGRSGKSDSLERLQELTATACFSQMATKDPSGFLPVDSVDGYETFEFQHVVDSYLDSSILKSLPERLMQVSWKSPSTWRNFWKTPEYEINYLEKILKASENWPPGGYHLLVDKKNENGKVIPGEKMLIVLKRPIIANQLFSTTLRGSGTASLQISDMGQKKSDKINFGGQQELFARHLLTDQKKLAHFKRLQKELNPAFENGIVMSQLLKNDAFFDSKAYARYQGEMAKILLLQLKEDPQDLSARALFITSFRREPPLDSASIDQLMAKIDKGGFSLTPKPSEEMHASDIEIYRNLLMKNLNLSQSKQCKSGTDRTAIGIALAVAQDDFFTRFGKEYLPDRMSPNENLFFKMKFHHALEELGRSVAVETKGYSGIKWGAGVPLVGGVGNPAALKYFFNKDDIALIKSYKFQKDLFDLEEVRFLEQKRVDVVKVKASDFRNKGKTQYNGVVVDKGLYGKSELKHIKELNKAKAKVSIDSRIKAEEAVIDFINENFFSLNPKISRREHLDDLEFLIQIKKLDVSEEERRKLDYQVSYLEEKKGKTESEQLELYIFKRLQGLLKMVDDPKMVLLKQHAISQVMTTEPSKKQRSASEFNLEEVLD